MSEYKKLINKMEIDYKRIGALLVVEDKLYPGTYWLYWIYDDEWGRWFSNKEDRRWNI